MPQRQSIKSIGILGSLTGPYVRELTAAAYACDSGISVQIVSFADLSVALMAGQLSVTSIATAGDAQPTQVNLLALDALIVRTMPLGTLEQVIYRMDALQAVERRGVPVVNPPRTLEIAIDKWLTLERLSRGQVPTPSTVACQSREAAMVAFEQLGRDVVVKPIFGGEGRGIVRATDPDMAWRIFSTLSQLGSVLYVQEFLPNFGYDIRVLKIGQKWLSVKRRSPAGEWRTNVSLGSQAEPHDLTDHERQLAERAAEATGGSFLGIDLMPTRDGRTVVLEVNAVPGWRGTAQALGVNIAKLVIEHLKELHAARD